RAPKILFAANYSHKLLANQEGWDDLMRSLPLPQQQKLLKLWMQDMSKQTQLQDDSLNWAVPLLHEATSSQILQQLQAVLEVTPENVRHEFWWTALEGSDCWTILAKPYGSNLVPDIIPVLQRAAKTMASTIWWQHWMTGVKTLIAVGAGDVSVWVPNILEALSQVQVDAVDPEFLRELERARNSRFKQASQTSKTTKDKKGRSSNKSRKSSLESASELSSTTIWVRLRELVTEGESAERVVLQQHKELQSKVTTLQTEQKNLRKELENIRAQLHEEINRREEVQIAYEHLSRTYADTEEKVTYLQNDIEEKHRIYHELQISHHELSILHEKTKIELSEWQRMADMWEHQSKQEREAGKLEFRDKLRRGPVRIASYVKDYLEHLLEGDSNPELIPSLALSFDELHRYLLSLADLPQEMRIRRELLPKPEDS
ncbi:MAG: hypothetical protein C7B47_11535, partial [Sulfobacillus thermosulfidooxidans]